MRRLQITETRTRRREVERFEKPANLPALGAINWTRNNLVPQPDVEPFLPPFTRSDW